MEKIKKYKIWYYIFLVLGLYGLLDIVVGVIIKQPGSGFENANVFAGFMIVYAFLYLFGTKVATSILPFAMGISFTWFLWLGVSVLLLRRIKKLENKEPTESVPAELNKNKK